MAKTAGYVLPAESASTEDFVTFPGMPGRFLPGVPLSAHHLGLDEEEIDRRIEESGLPLQKVTMSEADATAEIDRGDNFAPSSQGREVEAVEPTPEPPEVAEVAEVAEPPVPPPGEEV